MNIQQESNDHNLTSLEEVRDNFHTNTSRIVEWFKLGNRREASPQEIADSIVISNNAEEQTVYSALDPYTESAEKRVASKPLLFKRDEPAIYKFLGYEGDPLDLVNQVQIKAQSLNMCYKTFISILKQGNKFEKFVELPTSKKAVVFHNYIEKNPSVIEDANKLIELQNSLPDINL